VLGSDSRVIVTGSAGFVGWRVCSQLRDRGCDVIECDRDEDVLSWVAPPVADAVIHLAANKYATQAEANPYEVCRFNIDATAAAIRLGRVILASTCKAADPITCYGASKLICERMVLNAGGTVVRLVNVLGSTGSVVNIWAALPEEEPLPVTDCVRMFLEPEDAARLLVDALDLPPGRYAPAHVPVLTMDELAAMLHPSRAIVEMPLRVGDRPEERLLNEYEQRYAASAPGFVQILDRWEQDADVRDPYDWPADAGADDRKCAGANGAVRPDRRTRRGEDGLWADASPVGVPSGHGMDVGAGR
jgi:FlaA1/EpsC-like NDP-sugar epimerase